MFYQEKLKKLNKDRESYIGAELYSCYKIHWPLKGDVIGDCLNKAVVEYMHLISKRGKELEEEFYQDLKKKAKQEAADFLIDN